MPPTEPNAGMLASMPGSGTSSATWATGFVEKAGKSRGCEPLVGGGERELATKEEWGTTGRNVRGGGIFFIFLREAVGR